MSGPFPHDYHNVPIYANNNRFSGGLLYEHNSTIIYDAAYDCIYTVNNNRLSGRLPAAVLRPAPINRYCYTTIMTGNLFSCNWAETDVPSGTRNYQCGTNNLDRTFVSWLTLVLLVVVLLCFAYGRAPVVISEMRFWVTTSELSDFGDLAYVWELSRSLSSSGVVTSGVCVVLLAPIYVLLTVFCGTYTYQYGYTVASILLSGPVAFSIQSIAFAFVLCFVMYKILIQKGLKTCTDVNENIEMSWRLRTVAVCTVYVAINFGVVGTVNVVFIATSLYAPSLEYQVAISAFKFGWGALCMPYLTRWMVYELGASRKDVFTLELLVSLMNNIALPFFAVMAVSEGCFFDLYRGALSSYTLNARYEQPYYYSYQCAYTFFNTYVAAFVYLCLLNTFGLPLVELATLQLHSRTAEGSYVHYVLNRLLPRVLRPIPKDPELVLSRNIFRPYFDSTQFLVGQYTTLALILTFGVVFPPVAVCLAVSMVAANFYARVKVGRMLSNAAEAKQGAIAAIVEDESRGAVSTVILRRAGWMLLFCSCWFMTLFLFDTLGDAQGVRKAYWVLIVAPVLPVVVYVGVAAYGAFRPGVGVASTNKSESEAGSVELTHVEVVSPMAAAASV